MTRRTRIFFYRRVVPRVFAAGAAMLVTLGVTVVLASLSDRVKDTKTNTRKRRNPILVVAQKRPPPRRVKRRRTRGPKQTAGPVAALPALDLPAVIPPPPAAAEDVEPGELVRSTLRAEKKLTPAKDLVLTEEMVDGPPRVMGKADPVYPLAAQERGIEGSVKLKVLIGRDGRVEEVIVVHSEPKGVFEKAARAAVARWRFRPATFKGEPVRVWALQTITFSLQ
jgi:protein TonB